MMIGLGGGALVGCGIFAFSSSFDPVSRGRLAVRKVVFRCVAGVTSDEFVQGNKTYFTNSESAPKRPDARRGVGPTLAGPLEGD